MTRTRPPVEVLHGAASDAVRGIEGDFALLSQAPQKMRTRVWTCDQAAVVLGVSRDCHAEVDLEECRARSTAVLRRASGGGTVVIGPGTLQYAIVVPHVEAQLSIDTVKRMGGRLVLEALAAAGIREDLSSDPWGDIQLADRKVAGIALRRRREATLLHGCLLVEANLDEIAALLRHPIREPAWRRGRPHRDFLANLGALDSRAFEHGLAQAAAALDPTTLT